MLTILFIFILSLGLFTYNSATTVVTKDELDVMEVQTSNSIIEVYEGQQMGTQVKALLGHLIMKVENNSDTLLDIQYVPGDGPNVDEDLLNITSNSIDSQTELITKLIAEVDSTHYYDISFEYDDMGYIEKIIINY